MSFNFHDLVGSLVEDDAPRHQAQADPAPSPVALPPAPVPQYQMPVPVTGEVADHQDNAYQSLAAKTQWEKGPAFVAIQKYLAPMKDLAIDDKTKFSIAIKQAQAQDGIDPAAVNQNFETMKATLQAEATKFAQLIASKTATDVDAKKTQAEQLQAQVQQLTEDAFTAQQKLQTAQHRFDVALQTRLTEITQEQAKYASLLA